MFRAICPTHDRLDSTFLTTGLLKERIRSRSIFFLLYASQLIHHSCVQIFFCILHRNTYHISPSVDHVPAELIQAVGKILYSELHIFLKLIWNKEQLPHQ